MISLRGVTKRYGDQVVLDGLDLALPDGAATAVMGPNGSGKTTLGRLLLGLEAPDAGEVQGVAGAKIGNGLPFRISTHFAADGVDTRDAKLRRQLLGTAARLERAIIRL